MLCEQTPILDPGIFRTYDIRGIVGEGLTESVVFLIGKALGSFIREQGKRHVVIARDARLSGEAFSQRLYQGLMATGCDVTDVGIVPTPLLYYAAHALQKDAGVMVTGSHNPGNYNGLKMVVNGVSLTEQEIKALYHRIQAQQFLVGEGTLTQRDIVPQYFEQFINNIKLARPLKIVIDAGNGVTGMIAPSLFRAIGCDVHELFCELDGHFPNHHPDPSEPKNLNDLIAAVKDLQADVGLAFDGDGDRLGVVTKQGDIIWPDRLLMQFAKSLLKAKSTHSPVRVIYDVKCTHHLATLIKAHDGEPIMWKTGHSLIKAKMAETSAQLAGEMSGHFFFKDRWYGFDDALYAGGRLLEILSQENRDSDQIFADIPNSINTPELKVAVPDAEKFSLMQQLIDQAYFNDAQEVMTIDGLRINFADGWGLVRPSNTTPYLILRFEATNETILTNIQSQFRNWMLGVRPDLVLPF